MSVPLHVEIAGERGPLLVLQHGFGGSARNWRPQVRALRDRARIVTFDARGHARSAQRPETRRFGLADFVRDFGDVAALHAGETPFVAGGLSLGAAVALRFALTSPERVRGLVLAAVPAGRQADPALARTTLDFADAVEREGLEAAGARFVWGERSGLDAGAARLVRQGFCEHPPEAIAAILRETIAGLPSVQTLAPAVAGMSLPTLIVVGEQDSASLEPSRALARAIPAARLVEIEGAGHVVNLAQPRRFDAALLAFLDELETEGNAG